MKILKSIMVILGPAAVGFLIGVAAAVSGVELPGFFIPAVVVIMIAALNNALKPENTKSRVKSILLISLTPFLIVIVLLSVSFVSPIKQLIAGEAGSEYIIDATVKSINEDAPKTLDEEVLLIGATAISDKVIQIDWKLYTLSKDELDLEQAETILREDYIQPALEEGRIFGIWKKHSITITYSITDKDDIHLFDISFGPDDY